MLDEGKEEPMKLKEKMRRFPDVAEGRARQGGEGKGEEKKERRREGKG